MCPHRRSAIQVPDRLAGHKKKTPALLNTGVSVAPLPRPIERLDRSLCIRGRLPRDSLSV